MNLYMDVGNTRIKWRHQEMSRTSVADSLEILEAQWRDFPDQRISRVFGSCVRGKQQAGAIDLLSRDVFGLGVGWQVSSAQSCGVTNAYSNPLSLGVDRWLALIAAHARFPEHTCIVIDAGTAITIDLLEANGRHRGGLIMPGARTMLSSMGKADQLFPDVGINLLAAAASPEALTSNTRDALVSGSIFAVQGGVKAVIEKQCRQIGAKIEALPILITGGDLAMLNLDSLRTHIAPDLVLEGLQRLTEKNL